MNEKEEEKISMNILKHLENLSSQINELVTPQAESVLRKYPIAFGLLILTGVMLLHEGLKGFIRELGILDINPSYLIIMGLALLIITGTIYKKLEK